MLHIKIDYDNTARFDKNIIQDVEAAFKSIKLTGTKAEKDAIRLLDKGEYKDSAFFVDRFGGIRYLSDLSTGCKAILCVLHNPDKWVNTIECGLNALSILVSVCKDGKIVMRDIECTLGSYGLPQDVCVEMDGHEFYTYDDFNDYLDTV